MLILKKKIWAFIPARAGSKSIKNKNIKKINSIPLLIYSLKTALSLKKKNLIDEVIFSSDSERYIELVKKYSNKIKIDYRMKKDATDNATDLDVFKSFLKKKKNLSLACPEFFLHLRPTTPLRKNKILIDALNFFKKNNKKYSALRSVSLMDNSSYKSMRIVNGKLCNILEKNFNMDKLNFPRQSYIKTYVGNGYVDIIKSSNIIKNIIHGNKVCPFVVNDFNSDIDNLSDLAKVRWFKKNDK